MSASIHAKTTAASSPIIFADGTEYQCSPQTDKDIAEIDEWLQCRVNELAVKACRNIDNPAERAELLRIASINAGTVSCATNEGSRMLATVDGWARLTWQAIRKYHPEITFVQIREKMLDPANIELAKEKFRRLNVGTAEITPLKKDVPVRNRHKKKRRRN